MSDFSPAWLALREPADRAARDPGLTQALAHWCRARGTLKVLDLGAGTGSNLRYLAPRLGVNQAWRLIDHDPRLLASLPGNLLDWAARHGYPARHAADGLRIRINGCDVHVQWSREDLATRFEDDWLAGIHLVSASALLDLASARWIETLAAACHREACAALFALTYDGRIQWRPAVPGDGQITDALNRHQLRDKGLGPALGPGAAKYAADTFAALGRAVRVARGDWSLGPESGDLQEALASGWASAALELDPAAGGSIEDWLDARRALLRQRTSWLNLGHQDLLSLPPGR